MDEDDSDKKNRRWYGVLGKELHEMAWAEAKRRKLKRAEMVRLVFAQRYGDISLADLPMGRPKKEDDPDDRFAGSRPPRKVMLLSALAA